MHPRTFTLALLNAFLVVLLIGCTDPPPGTATDYRQQLEAIRETLQKIRAERDELAVQNAALSVAMKDGQYIAEKGKQLAAREAELDRRGEQLTEKTMANDQFFSYLKNAEAALYEKTAKSLTAVGEAQQIKREYEALRTDKLKAETSRDNYLAAIFVLAVLFIVMVA